MACHHGILPLLGTWAAFNRKVSEYKQEKSLIKDIGLNHIYMRLLKETFDVLVQYHVDEITNVYREIDQELLENLKCLRRDPSP